VFEHVARIRFCVDDDHVGLQAGDVFGQVEIGRQRGDQVVPGLRQAGVQGLRACLTFVRRMDQNDA